MDFMTDAVLKELWLHSVCDYEPECVNAVLAIFENPENAFGARIKDAERIKKTGIPKRFIKEAENIRHLKKSQLLLEYCNKKGIRIITMESEEYPLCLKHVYMPPRILFALGKKLDFENNIGVSVVGCRQATDKGLVMAEKIGASLAQNSITVVSGMAEGIDAAAMNGALKMGGTVVAVLAGGVEDIYPRSNKGLYYRTIENGTVISERPPGTKVKRYFYQHRNRIMVGLSEGVVITEGKVKGGTAITARLATDNNRDVFAVPGSPVVWQAKLPNSLISSGAFVVEDASVPTEHYKNLYPDKIRHRECISVVNEENKGIKGLTEEDKKIIEILHNNGNTATVEMIAEKCDVAINRINSRITILSIKGIIRQESGNRILLVREV